MSATRAERQFIVRSKRPRRASVPVQGPIWVVDDNLDDAKLAERVLQQLSPKFSITILGSGQELVDRLRGKLNDGSSVKEATPCAILLDMKMPEMDGLAVLEWCTRQSEAISNIPIIVLTNFGDLPFMKRAYALGARSYLLKPVDHNALRSVFTSLSISV